MSKKLQEKDLEGIVKNQIKNFLKKNIEVRVDEKRYYL
jgi:hypothetical protein